MTDQNSSRSKQLIGLGQVGVTSFIREPVREAVREALVEERASADEQGEHTQRSVTEDRTELRAGTGSFGRRCSSRFWDSQ